MKKVLISIVAAAAALLATSCTNELITDGDLFSNETTVRFVVKAPQVTSRAGVYGTGKAANDLYYAVYDKDGKVIPAISKTTAEQKEFIDIETTVEFKLVNGNWYSIIFWAENEASVATIDWDKQEMTYNPTKANQEHYDAFWAYVDPFRVTNNFQQPEMIELTRPFSQINIGTDDFDDAVDAGTTMVSAGMRVTLPNVLNLASGKVSGEATLVYANEAFPTEPEVFPIDGYKYLAMNYVLVDDTKHLINLTFTHSDSVGNNYEVDYPNVPVRRNYQTNIYGSAFTSVASYKISIKPTPTVDPEYNYDTNK